MAIETVKYVMRELEHNEDPRYRWVDVGVYEADGSGKLRSSSSILLPAREAYFLASLMKFNHEPGFTNINGWHSPKRWLEEIARRFADPIRWSNQGGKYLNIRFDSRDGFSHVTKDVPGGGHEPYPVMD